MKIKGNELTRFCNEAWPGSDWYWDHEAFDIEPDPDVIYDTDDLGPVMWQGNPNDDHPDLELAKLIRQWRKTLDSEVFSVAVPKDHVKEFKAALKSFGASIA